jgi:hypothetical protein
MCSLSSTIGRVVAGVGQVEPYWWREPPAVRRNHAVCEKTAERSPTLGRMESESEPPTWQQRKTRAAAAGSPHPRRLRFGYAIARPPKPRGIAGIFQARSEYAQEVSTTQD